MTLRAVKTRPTTTRQLCEASFRSAWMYARSFEVRLTPSSLAGLLVKVTGSPIVALKHVEGNSDMAAMTRCRLHQMIAEEGTCSE